MDGEVTLRWALDLHVVGEIAELSEVMRRARIQTRSRLAAVTRTHRQEHRGLNFLSPTRRSARVDPGSRCDNPSTI